MNAAKLIDPLLLSSDSEVECQKRLHNVLGEQQDPGELYLAGLEAVHTLKNLSRRHIDLFELQVLIAGQSAISVGCGRIPLMASRTAPLSLSSSFNNPLQESSSVHSLRSAD